MNHLTAEALNMYLDGALDPHGRAAADAHLATCPTCRGELAALRQLYVALEQLPPDPLPADLTAQVLGRIARDPIPRIEDRATKNKEQRTKNKESTYYGLRTTDYGQNTQPALAIVALIVQIALTVALAVWLTPRLMSQAMVGLALLQVPVPSDLASALAELNDELASAGTALLELARVGGALNIGPLSGFSAAQWAMLLAGVGIMWFFSNRLLLAGSHERRDNHQEAA